MRSARQPKTATIDLPPLSCRADVVTVDEENRTVELVFSTGAPVERFDWWSGKRYIEKLSLKPGHMRMDRLNAGAPLLDTHSSWSITDQIGVVETGSVKLTAKEARATVRFSKREAVDPIWNDVRDGIIRNVSVGYRVHKFEEETGKNEIPVRTAVDWEPYEISMVPMPADNGAKVREDEKRHDTNPCAIVMRTTETAMKEEQTPSEYLVEEPAGGTEQRLALETETPREPNDHDRGKEAERARINGIMDACRAARLPRDFQQRLIDEGVALVDAQATVFKEMSRREDPNGAPRQTARRIDVGDDPLVHKRAGIENALLHRVAPHHFKLGDEGRVYRGLTLLETAKVHLSARGVRVTGMSKNEIAAMALGLDLRAAGMHTTSDFALLLADVASKTLRQEYELAPQTFTPIARRITLPDYKPSNRLQIGEAPALKKVEEHGEYTYGTIGEGREQMQLAKYGRKFAITREAIINDDTDAFSRIPAKFGRAARNLESNLVWFQVLSNPTMGDGNALFSVAHGNIDASGNVISIISIGAGRAAMRLQTGKDSDDTTYIDASARYLIVPPSLETVADQFVSTALVANAAGQVNPFGGRLTVISEPRLEVGVTTAAGTAAGSALSWYLAAAAGGGIDVLEYGYLDGEEGPVVESRIGWDVDGLEIKCRLDFAAKAIDWKGIYKNNGDEIT